MFNAGGAARPCVSCVAIGRGSWPALHAADASNGEESYPNPVEEDGHERGNHMDTLKER